MKLLYGVNCMVDLETLDTTSWAVIRSIGACIFCRDGVVRTFYQNVDAASCSALGMSTSPETLQWWEAQPADAKAALETDKVPLKQALERFSQWYGRNSLPTWGNGSDFDNAILQSAFKCVGLPCTWKFWDNRCIRTARALFPKSTKPFDGVKHNALDDAVNQAKELIDLDRQLRTLTNHKD